MKGLKVAQFGLFLILLGFTVGLFSNFLFLSAVGVGVAAAKGWMGDLNMTFKLMAWGTFSLPIVWILAALVKLLCAGAPEEKARTLIVASMLCDFVLIGGFFFIGQSAANFIVGIIVMLIAAGLSYPLFLQFLARMGDNVGEPRVGQYTGVLYGLIGTSWIFGIVFIFSPTAGIVGANLFGLATTCFFNYTIYTLFRALPLYIEEVSMGITDPTESAEDRAKKERKERLTGPTGGAVPKAAVVEEPLGTPPEGHKLYRVPKGLEPLHLAVKEGDNVKVERQLAMGESPGTPIKNGLTPLHIASSVGVMEVADTLIKAGAKVGATCDMGLTPIYFAIQTGNPNIVGFLVNKGANLFHQNEQGYTPLHWACCAPHAKFKGPVRVKMVHLLISQGADINAQTHDGKTPRDLAVENQLENVITALDRHLNKGQPVPAAAPAEIKVESVVAAEPLAYPPFVGTELCVLPKDMEPLHAAVKDGEPEKVQRQIAEGANVRDPLPNGMAPIHITAVTGVMSVSEMLIRFGATPNDVCAHNITPIFLAVRLNNLAMVGYLVSRKGDVNHQDEIGRTPLHWAVAVEHEKLVGQNRNKMVEFLLENGANHEIKDNSGFTPLELARAAGQEEIVGLLEAKFSTPVGVGATDSALAEDDDDYYV